MLFRSYTSPQDSKSEEKMSDSDYILVLTPSELDTVRTALRAESERCRKHGFDGLREHTDNLRDKISNSMIEQTQARLDKRVKV